MLAQSRTFYGADGRVSGRSITGSNGSTTFYDASGRVTGRSTTSGNLTTSTAATDAVSAQPDKRDDMRQDNDQYRMLARRREIIAMLERTKSCKLTEQEINLLLEQARALGEL